MSDAQMVREILARWMGGIMERIPLVPDSVLLDPAVLEAIESLGDELKEFSRTIIAVCQERRRPN